MNLVVVGLGYVGLPLAISAADCGYKVYGYDIDTKKIDDLQKGILFSGDISSSKLISLQETNKLTISNTLPKLTSEAIFVIAVPTPIGLDRKPQLDILIDACEKVANIVTSDSLIISESTSYVGTLRNLIKPLIENKSNATGLKYAVAPERIDPGNKVWELSNTPRVIGGLNSESAHQAAFFYRKFCSNVHVASSPEVAEAAKLIENTFRNVNIALVNEIAGASSGLGFSMNEAIEAAATKPFGFMPFFPSIGVGGHCIPVDPSYLSFSAANIGIETQLINLADKVNQSTPLRIAMRIKLLLGNELMGRKIQFAGIAYKPNTSDTRESPTLVLMTELRKLGAEVKWFDPLVESFGSEISEPLDIHSDLGIITVPHDQIDFSPWLQAGTNVIDLSISKQNYGWSKFL